MPRIEEEAKILLGKFPSPLERLLKKREKGECVGQGGREEQGKEMKAGRRKGREKDGKSLLGVLVCKEGRCQPHCLSLSPGLCFPLCKMVVTQSVKDT